jgi:hypothetical protein
LLSHALESRVDLGGQEVSLELAGIDRIKRMKSESSPRARVNGAIETQVRNRAPVEHSRPSPMVRGRLTPHLSAPTQLCLLGRELTPAGEQPAKHD